MAKNRFNSILDSIERVGNRLPHPATLFMMMAAIVAVISAIGAGLELSALHPATGETIEARSLLSSEGIRWIYTNVEHNFVKFPPLGLVLVIMIGIGVAEGSGLFTVLVKNIDFVSTGNFLYASPIRLFCIICPYSCVTVYMEYISSETAILQPLSILAFCIST